MPRLKRKSLRRLYFFTVVLLALFIIGTTLAGYGSLDLIPSGQQEMNRVMEALSGKISPFKVDMTQPFDLMLSPGVTLRYTGLDLSKGFYLNTAPYFRGYNLTDSQFQVQFDKDRMYVTANIKDSNNNLIAQIVNNTWTTVNPHYELAFWDRNYNAYAFEIITSDSVPLLQVVMVGPNKIQLGGIFYTKNGRVAFFPAGENAEILQNVTDEELKNRHIDLIFEYPALTSPSNMGKMRSPWYYPSSNPLSEPDSKIQTGYILFYFGTILAAVSLTVMSFVIAAIIERRKKPQTIPNVTFAYTVYPPSRNKGKSKKGKNRRKRG